MTNTKDIIIKLKEVREEKNLSYGDILDLMEKNGDFLAKSTISRVFADGSENKTFMYEETIRPIAKALLDMETIEDDDTMDIKAMKSLLKYKIQRIEELEKELDKQKIKAHEKLESERGQSRKSIEFLKEQVSLKDKRMDMLLTRVGILLDMIAAKDEQINKMTDGFISREK